jgi:hypothetical protein
MVASDPYQGGATWAVLQYVLGLRRLGHDVLLVDPARSAPDAQVAEYFGRTAGKFGIEERAALLVETAEQSLGLPYEAVRRFASRADVLLNISGTLRGEALIDAIPVRVYLDLDPAFVQLWQAVEGIDMCLDAHTHFVSISDTVGTADGPIPSCGRSWIPTLPPVVLSEWPMAECLEHDALTTVGNWRGYGSIEHDGVHYGQKAHSLRPLMDLPTRTTEQFRLALAIHPDEVLDRAALDENGWELLDPADVAATPDDYRCFVQGSKAELGIAKSGYVVSDSGWFSDRSACYLASGRPVIAQDTGFGRRLPTGDGLFAFADADDVVAAIDELRADYDRHRAAAREIAEAHLDSDRVLRALLERVGVA